MFSRWQVAHDSRRYDALKSAVGKVSDKMLIQHLKEMTADGLVFRRDLGDIPPRVESSLKPFDQTQRRWQDQNLR